MTMQDTHYQRNPAHQGLSWIALSVPGQPPILGLGGPNTVVNMGELSLTELVTPQIATLTLGMHNLNPSLTLGFGNIRAQIKFGIGAANEEVFLDWGTQSSICLPCGKLNINAVEVDGHPTVGLPNIQVPILLTAQLAAGPRSSLGWPTLTSVFELPKATTVVIAPPKRAKRLLVGDPRGIASSDTTVTVQGLHGSNVYDLANPADSAIRTEGVILPGTTEQLIFFSVTGLTLPGRLTVCFMLDG